MLVIPLGVSAAFIRKRPEGEDFQSNFLIRSNTGKYFIIDFGDTVLRALEDIGLDQNDIDAGYVSHPHSDHSGFVSVLGKMRTFLPTSPSKLTIYANSNVAARAWEAQWKGPLITIPSIDPITPQHFLDLRILQDDPVNGDPGEFNWEGINFKLVQVYHAIGHRSFMPCYGLFMTTPEGKKFFFSSDTKYFDGINYFIDKANYALLDCNSLNIPGVHATYDEWVAHLSPDLRERSILYHYPTSNGLKPRTDHGFVGFARTHQVFDTENPDTFKHRHDFNDYLKDKNLQIKPPAA